MSSTSRKESTPIQIRAHTDFVSFSHSYFKFVNVDSNPTVDIALESGYFSDTDYSFNQFTFQNNDDGNAHGPMIDPNNYFF